MTRVWLRFVTEPAFSSWVIRTATWSDWSHVDFVLTNGNFLGARFSGGVQSRSHDYLTPSKFCYASVQVADIRKVLGWATGQIGKPYDWRAILGFGFRRDWHDPGQWLCSELVAEAFRKMDAPIVDDQSYRVTPQDDYESVRVQKEPIGSVPSWIRAMGHSF